jgi:hypothetical protein
VLITAAAGAVGIAAIRIANHLGATPIVTTRNEAKGARLAELGAAHVITTEEEHLVKDLHVVTDGRGADIVLDAIAGPGLETLAQAVAPAGTLIVTSNLDPRPTPLPWTWPLHVHKYGLGRPCIGVSATDGDIDDPAVLSAIGGSSPAGRTRDQDGQTWSSSSPLSHEVVGSVPSLTRSPPEAGRRRRPLGNHFDRPVPARVIWPTNGSIRPIERSGRQLSQPELDGEMRRALRRFSRITAAARPWADNHAHPAPAMPTAGTRISVATATAALFAAGSPNCTAR